MNAYVKKQAARWGVIAGAALALFAAMPAGAQPLDTPPPPGAPRAPSIATPSEQRLANGLRVIAAERHGVPLVTARLVVLSGAELDPPQRAGLASLTAGLLTRGTRHHSAPVLARLAEALGGTIESSADWDASSVSITVTTPMLPSALGLLAEVAMEPAFAPDEIERYRAQVLDEMKVSYAEPGVLSMLAAQRAVFGSGAYGHPRAGTPASLPRITREDLVHAHAAAFRPDNAVLVLSGDITPQAAMQLAQRSFGPWKAPSSPLPQAGAPLQAPWPGEAVVIDMPGVGQSGVAVALPAVAGASPDRIAGEVTNAVFGLGYSSRLNQEIRIKRGLSYGAHSAFDARRASGVLRAGVQTKNASAAEVVGLVQQQLDALMKTPVAADELNSRRAALIGEFSRQLETTQGLAAASVELAVLGLPQSELTKRIDELQAVGPQQVQDFANKYFMPERRKIAVAGVSADFLPALKAMVREPVVVPQAALDLEAPLPRREAAPAAAASSASPAAH